MTAFEQTIDERDEILRTMDIERAKAFIAAHGGFVPKRPIDWEKVLHLARYEVTSLSEEFRRESRIWLAQHGVQSLMALSLTGPYLRVTIDLIFPRDSTDAYLAEHITEIPQ